MGLLSWLNGWADRRVYAFAKGIAKAQVDTYRRVVADQPGLSREDAYVALLTYRPGYDETKAREIVDAAQVTVDGSFSVTAEKRTLRLRDVVLGLALIEYARFMGRAYSAHDVTIMIAAIREAVPGDF